MSVAGAYRRLPSPLRRAAKSAVLRADAAVHRRLGRHLAVSAMGEAEDDVFLDELYQRALGRPIDPEGLRTFGAMLAAGESRVSVILEVARSDECVNRLLSDRFALPSLVELRPDRFPTEPTRDGAKQIPVYVAETAEDFDWIERGVLDHGYYEKPGIWSLGVDLDKQVMAECLAAFAPTLGLEMGCASGAVLECLAAHGVVSEGVEISSMAIARAASEVRPRIHHGDVLDLDLAPDYDLVFGLDIFEHLNPNRLDEYLSRLRDLLVPGGFLFANVPAYGTDPVFGEVFPLYLESWVADAAAGRPFRRLHVDTDGYPLHGHLIWADTTWWVGRFEAAGLRREPRVEQALHGRYDPWLLEATPARRAFFVFSRDASPDAVDAVVARASVPSAVLEGRMPVGA